MNAGAEFPNYAIACWNRPIGSATRVETRERDFVLAKNTDGESHVVLFFDLRPGAEIEMTIRQPKSKVWKH